MARRTRLALSVVATLLVAAAGAAETVRIVADRAEVRREANAGGSILGAVSRGTVLQVLGREGGWVQVAYPIGNGAFYGGYVPEVFCEDARGAAPSASQPPTPTPPVGVRPKDAWFTDPSAGLEPAPEPITAPASVAPVAHQPTSERQKPAGATLPLERLGVFVVTWGELGNGLVEKDQMNSRKDLEGKLRQGRKHVSLASFREASHLLLVIGQRGIANSGSYIPGTSTTTAYVTSPYTATAHTTTGAPTPIYVGNVGATLLLSADRRPLRTFSGSGLTWKGAANDIAKQVDDWVGLNKTAIGQLLREAGAGPSPTR